MDNQPSNDISHPVRDAFLEWGHRASVAATSLYLAVPTVMAASPAYGHETGERHTHINSDDVNIGLVAGVGIGLFAGRVIENATRNKSRMVQGFAYLTASLITGAIVVGASYIKSYNQ